MNQRGDGEIIVFVLIAAVLLIGGFFLWKAGVESNERFCKEKYGQEYTLHMNKSNSSVQSCLAPDGTLKEL